MNRTIIGLDLEKEYTQISYYYDRMQEPETVSVHPERDRYLIPTPEDLFSLIEESAEPGLTVLANFLKSCVSCIGASVDMRTACMMITMREMKLPWPEALLDACEMMGMSRASVFLQNHQESFCSFVLNQKKELWTHQVALFEYEDTAISAWTLSIDYSTRPAVVKVDAGTAVDFGRKGSLSDEQYNEKRDQKFMEVIEETFQKKSVSCVYLIGDSFDKTWAVESFGMLCRKRHVFQGRNLYTKGACYAAMERVGAGKKLDNFLFFSDDMVQTNLSMQMDIRGKNCNYLLIGAGVNWFEASHVCEFIPEDTKEIIIYGKSMLGGEPESYSILLKELPDRPARTTRLQMQMKFVARDRCKVTIRDLGFGEFYPVSGHVWETVLEV